MFRFILRRILVAIPLLFASSIVTFLLVTNIGTPKKIEDAIARPNHSQTQISQLRIQFGIDKQPVARYVDWFTGFVKGDWGQNATKAEIRPLMWQRIQVTLRLLIAASIMSVILGVLVGIIGAIRQYTAFDYFMTFFAFLFFSIPAAVLAGFLKEWGAIKMNPWLRNPSMSTTIMITIAAFGLVAGYLIMRNRLKYERVRPRSKYITGAVAGLGIGLGVIVVFKLGWDGNVYRVRNPKPLIPTVGQTTPGFEGDFLARMQDYFWHMLLPSTALILIGFAGYSRYMRASMLDVMSSDYVRTARAKGISEKRVTVLHGVRNALIPLITIVALDFGALLSGAIITETIFGWSGMGRFFSESLAEKDPRSLLAFVMVTAVSVVLFNLIADIIYAQLDPRIRID
ncbi:MAG: ABC transporter permease [Actinomycetota bacterium]|nr:ABC transporter permease [Actinomycetota bacterium]